MPDKKEREPRYLHIFTEKFTEGQWHVFLVVKMLQIPGDDYYYVMESKAGNRLLMPFRFYVSYGIKPGGIISCLIDKINCSGRIFLEPAHPFFNMGQQYDFTIRAKEELVDRKGRLQTYYTLSVHGNMQYKAIVTDEIALPVPANIRATFIRTRKGILMLSEIEVINNCL